MPAPMPIGFNCRGSAGGATDTPPDILLNTLYNDGAAPVIYNSTRGHGYKSYGPGPWGELGDGALARGQDIDSSRGARLAGQVFSATAYYEDHRTDMAPGIYAVRAAVLKGDVGARFQILDGHDTPRITLDVAASDWPNVLDASGASKTAAQWNAGNAEVEVLILSGFATARWGRGDSTTGGNTSVSHFSYRFVSSVEVPTVTDEPDSIEVSHPATATFSATLGGGAYSALQWQTRPNSGGAVTDVSGANTASYTTGATDLSMSGRQYRLAAAWAGGTAYSAWATLTVNAGPAGVVSDVTGTATGGTTATVSFTPGTPAATVNTLELESPSGAGNWAAPASTLAGNVFSVTGLSGATEYRPRVRASNAAGASAWAVGAAFSTDNVGTGGGEIPGVTMTPTVAIILLDEAGVPLQSVTGLRWTLYDKPPGDATAAVVARGAAGAANPTTGAFSVTATGRSDGDLLWLDVTNSDGTLTQSPGPRSFSGPVAVEMV